MKYGLSIVIRFLGCAGLMFLSTAWGTDHQATSQLQTLLENLQTYQAKFEQAHYNDHHQLVQQDHGSILLKRPGKLYWAVDVPSQQITIINGQVLWIYDVALQEATKRVWKQSDSSPILLLSGSPAKLLKHFSVAMTTPSPDRQVFILQARSQQAMVPWMQLEFVDRHLVGLAFQDNLGQKHVLRFIAVKWNAPLSDHWFEFKVPKHVDVIDHTHHGG